MAPNILAAAAVLAVMGFAGIPLNMMTAAIAAVSIGIGVDFAIHYLHRYRTERQQSGDAATAIAQTHGSIGRALFLTGLTVMVGFSVLCFSNFVPTHHVRPAGGVGDGAGVSSQPDAAAQLAGVDGPALGLQSRHYED